jgi:hypothetical protein
VLVIREIVARRFSGDIASLPERSRPEGGDGTTVHPKERLPVESRKEPAMIPELFRLHPAVLAFDPEQPSLPLWLKLGLAGAVTLFAALAYTLGGQ